jgi:hypothetical protein
MGIFDKFKKYSQDPKQNIPQEVYGTPDTMNRKDNEEDDDILFYFSKKPSFGKQGDDGGYSTTIFIDNRVLREKYEFGNNKSVSQETIILSDDDMSKLLDIMDKYGDEIESYPEKMYSCLDGDMYKFAFGTKVIELASGLGDKHPIFKIVKQIMRVVDSSKRKYNISPCDNMPRCVYAPPEVMCNIHDIDFTDIMQQTADEIPNPKLQCDENK